MTGIGGLSTTNMAAVITARSQGGVTPGANAPMAQKPASPPAGQAAGVTSGPEPAAGAGIQGVSPGAGISQAAFVGPPGPSGGVINRAV